MCSFSPLYCFVNNKLYWFDLQFLSVGGWWEKLRRIWKQSLVLSDLNFWRAIQALGETWKTHQRPSCMYINCKLYRVTQKNVTQGFLAQICSRSPILLFRRCFGTRKSTPFHLTTSISPIQNQKYPKNAMNACADTNLSSSHIINSIQGSVMFMQSHF